jgi:hypothetical protein
MQIAFNLKAYVQSDNGYDLVMKLKIGFVNHLKHNVVTNEFLNYLLESKQPVNIRSKSFYCDTEKIGNLCDSGLDLFTFSKNYRIYLALNKCNHVTFKHINKLLQNMQNTCLQCR